MRLVIDAANLARGGEVFVTKMPVIRIQDLAQVMIQELAPRFGHNPGTIEIKVIGTKAGEKMYEELMSEEETRRTIELPDYFAVLPAFKGIYRDIDYNYPDVLSTTVTNPYHSANETPLTPSELSKFLHENNLLEPETRAHPSERYWPDNSK